MARYDTTNHANARWNERRIEQPMGIVVVEICDGNLMMSYDLETLFSEEYPEVAVLTNDCLSFCGLCQIRPFVLVNGKRIVGSTPEECLANIRKAIDLELAMFF